MLGWNLQNTRRVCIAFVALMASGTACGAGDADLAYRWFSLPIEVSGLPAGAEFVPVSCPIDFSAMLARLKVPGAVDERSLRLDRLPPGGDAVEQAVQFSPSAQPRAQQRRFLPGTAPGVSYITEYPAGQTPEVPKVTGTLSWIARADADGKQRYRLRFGVLRSGRLIQVPFPPQNLRAFDGRGRAVPVHYFPRMQLRPQWPLEGVVHIWDSNELVTSYHVGPTLKQAGSPDLAIRRPFLYPVNGPDGIPLTELGKPHDPTGSHAHHCSLWIAHASVAGEDFWSEHGGIIAHVQLELMEDGPVFCRLIQTTRWMAKGVDLLHGRRCLTVYRTAGSFRLMDLTLELTPAGSQAVELGKTSFGFLAVRVAQSMTPFDGGGEILNARGDRNEQAAHLKRAAWLDQSGPIAPGAWGPDPQAGTPPRKKLSEIPPAKWGGIAVFDHPDNVNHPTTWHCRNDGWAGAAFNADRAYTIPAGGKLRLRYRIQLHRHNATEGAVARRYQEYSARPIIRLGQPVQES
jgi:hypothetical protein